MNVLVLDVETTGATNDTHGNPFTLSNKLCFVGCLLAGVYSDFDIEYSETPFGKNLEQIGQSISSADLLVGFNIKFDLHWLRRYNVSFVGKKIWDCQIFEYLVSRQKNVFASLDETGRRYGLGGKIDIVRTEYWEKGIDTDQVPLETLKNYLRQDVEELTYKIYLEQRKIYEALSKELQTLILLSFEDLLVLEEMEWNGLSYDLSESNEKAVELGVQITNLDKALIDITGLDFVNFNSGDVLSCILYGGTLKQDYKEVYTFTYKDGRTAQKERWAVKEHILPTLVKPLPKTGLKKDGYYKTDEGTLRKLRGNKKVMTIIKHLLERAKLEKLKSTYFEGFPKLHTEMEWEPDVMHGQLIQCKAGTGRLASSKPNQQNLPDAVRELVKTRFT